MDVAIIGAGKTGRTLGRLARKAGHSIGPVVCRTRAHAEEAVRFIGAGRPLTEPEGAELTLLGVPDRDISGVSRAAHLPAGAVMAHLCASWGADLLRPYRPAGALHPLRSFADPSRAADLFPGTACAIDGDEPAVEVLERFTRSIGGAPIRVRTDRKELYHAGAVFASNYLVAALEAALRLLGLSGVSRGEALPALLSLAEGALENVRAVGLPAALTGPVERGDGETVARHRAALAIHAPELSGAYAALGRVAIELALAKGTLDAQGAERLHAALGPAEPVHAGGKP
jgi:predicted short-subunit dehydrogenase-like oxidoreductase (DUF2520 family)